MELGVYSFGDGQRDPRTGQLGRTTEAMRNLLEAVKLADQVGLDFSGIGEHHTREMPASAATVVLATGASVTKRIRLGSAVTVLSTDNQVQVYQQFATLDALSNGRAEITAGRGSSTDSFPLFGFSLEDYDELYAEKLDLLLKINAAETVTRSGKHRPALQDALVVPRPDSGSLRIWHGTGGNPESSIRACLLGLPITYAIIGGDATRFAPLADLYRRAAQHAQVPAENVFVSIANPGFVGLNARKSPLVPVAQRRRSSSMASASRAALAQTSCTASFCATWLARPRCATRSPTTWMKRQQSPFRPATHQGGSLSMCEEDSDAH